jgi:hypothetical protein
VTVDYIRAYLPKDETNEHNNGEIAYSYTIKKRINLLTKSAVQLF